MSLNTVVNNLVRAAAGIPPDISDADLDRHVARLLAEEAKVKEVKWNELGLGAFLGGSGRESPDPSLPRPNKRFLASIIRNVDGHNTALLRAQAEAAREAREERLGEPSSSSFASRNGRGSAASRLFGGAMRGLRKGRSERVESRGGTSRLGARNAGHDNDRGAQNRELYGDRTRSHDERARHGRRMGYDDDDEDWRRNGGEDRAHSSRSGREDRGNRESLRARDREKDRGRRERSEERYRMGSDDGRSSRRGKRSRSRERSREDDSHLNRKRKPDGKRDRLDSPARSDGRSPPHQKDDTHLISARQTQLPSKFTSPPPSPPPVPRLSTPVQSVRCRSSSPSPAPRISKMDKYFHTAYDPRLDLGEVPKEGVIASVGWDNMLAILKERGKKKRHQSPTLSDDPYNVPHGITLRSPSPDLISRRVDKEEKKRRKEDRRKRRGGSDDEDEERERERRREKRRKERERERHLAPSSTTGGGREVDEGMFGVEYVKKGAVREWDKGK